MIAKRIAILVGALALGSVAMSLLDAEQVLGATAGRGGWRARLRRTKTYELSPGQCSKEWLAADFAALLRLRPRCRVLCCGRKLVQYTCKESCRTTHGRARVHDRTAETCRPLQGSGDEFGRKLERETRPPALRRSGCASF